MTHSHHIKVVSVSMALALLVQSGAMAQQAAITALPDSPGAVHSASLRTVAMSQQEPQPIPAQPDNSTVPQNPGDGTAAQPAATEPAASEQSENTRRDAEAPQSSLEAAQPSSQIAPPDQPHQAVGTAAAESVAVTGVAASRPAGAAVAPAKQRRVRTLLIKVGAVVGVGVAVGTTYALSQASPSRPPGSH